MDLPVTPEIRRAVAPPLPATHLTSIPHHRIPVPQINPFRVEERDAALMLGMRHEATEMRDRATLDIIKVVIHLHVPVSESQTCT